MNNNRIKDRIFGFILGGILFTVITSYAAYKYQASEIGYTPSNSNFDVDNVSDAIKELYEKFENSSSSTGIIGEIEKSDNYLPNGYFKSTAEDNNVIFGGYCWKIIRKTDDDDIRILYNGLPQDGECNRTGTDTQIDTSKFSTTYNVTDYASSTVKGVVDNWYNTNLAINYSEKISAIDLITREEASTIGGGYLVSGQSYWTQTPAGGSVTTTSSCEILFEEKVSKYNVPESCSSKPTGTISSSTVYILNGDGYISINNNGTYSSLLLGSCDYCYNFINNGSGTCYSYDQGTPYVNGSTWRCCGYKTYEGSCMAYENGSSLGVRPVITLNNTVTLTGGQGTSTNPYYLN